MVHWESCYRLSDRCDICHRRTVFLKRFISLLSPLLLNIESFDQNYFSPERTADTVTSTVESSISAVSGWKFFADENHWKNGFWEQKLAALGDLKQSDFSPESLEKLNQQILSTLDAAGKRFTAQFEISKAQSFNTLGLRDTFNFAEVKNFDVYNRNFQEFQSNLKAASETAISVTDNIVKTGGKAAVELNKMKDSSVQLLTEELKSNDFI